MIEVQLPDGSIAEFPAGTQDAVIEKALQQFGTKTEAASRVGKMGGFRKALYGAERGFDEAAMGVKQLFPKALGGGLSPDDQRELGIRREMENQIPGAWASRLAGDLAMFAVPGANITKAASVLPKAVQYAAAAGTGAGIGALQPVLEGESRSKNAIIGGAFGAGGQAVGDVGGRAIDGLVKKSAAARALPQNVQDAATLGQVADRNTGSGRLVAGLEERLKTVPVSGSMIERGRDRGMNAWRDDVIQSTAPKGFNVPVGTGREKADAVYKEFQSRYGKALKGHQVTPSQFFEHQLLNKANDPLNGLSKEQAKSLSDDIMRNYQGRFGAMQINRGPMGSLVGPQNPGTFTAMTGQSAKDFEAFLSSRSRQYAKGQGPSDPDIAKFYSDAERAWEAAYKRQLGSGYRKAIAPLDAKYAPYKTVERATSSVGNIGGDFTPQQLTTAVAARTGKARFGRGEGMLADEAQAGKSVFMDKLPSSGTAERGMTLAGGAAAMIDPISVAGLLAGFSGANLPLTTKVGKNLMTGDSKMQKMLQAIRAQQAVRNLGAPAGIAVGDTVTDESTRY